MINISRVFVDSSATRNNIMIQLTNNEEYSSLVCAGMSLPERILSRLLGNISSQTIIIRMSDDEASTS
jgi:hypothetical protein